MKNDGEVRATIRCGKCNRVMEEFVNGEKLRSKNLKSVGNSTITTKLYLFEDRETKICWIDLETFCEGCKTLLSNLQIRGSYRKIRESCRRVMAMALEDGIKLAIVHKYSPVKEK